MTLEETLKQLEALGNAGVRAQNAKSGAGDNQFGVSRGDVRMLANKIKTNHDWHCRCGKPETSTPSSWRRS